MWLLLLIYVVLRALWKIDVYLISTLVNKSLYYYYYYYYYRRYRKYVILAIYSPLQDYQLLLAFTKQEPGTFKLRTNSLTISAQWLPSLIRINRLLFVFPPKLMVPKAGIVTAYQWVYCYITMFKLCKTAMQCTRPNFKGITLSWRNCFRNYMQMVVTHI